MLVLAHMGFDVMMEIGAGLINVTFERVPVATDVHIPPLFATSRHSRPPRGQCAYCRVVAGNPFMGMWMKGIQELYVWPGSVRVMIRTMNLLQAESVNLGLIFCWVLMEAPMCVCLLIPNGCKNRC